MKDKLLYAVIGIILMIIGLKYHLFLVIFFLLSLSLLFQKKKFCLLFLILGSSLILLNKAISFPKKTSFVGMVIQSKDNYFLYASHGKRYYVYLNQNKYDIYDVLEIHGYEKEIADTSLEGEFSFKQYLKEKNIDSQIVVNKCYIRHESLIKNKIIKENIIEKLDDDAQKIYRGLIFNEFDEELRNDLTSLNVYSLFSATSIHFVLYLNIYYLVVRNITASKKWLLFSQILVFPLIIFANFKLSLIKSLIFFINYKILNNRIDKDLLLYMIISVILLVSSNYLFSISFIYVFVFSHFIAYINNASNMLNKNVKKIIKVILIQMMMAIPHIIFNNEYNYLSIIYFFIFYFLTQLIYLLSIIFLFIKPIAFILNPLSKLTLKMIKLFANIKSILYFDNLNIILGIILCFLFFFIIYFLELSLKRISKIMAIVFSSCIIICSLPLSAKITSYICFINVGQGDCILIHNHDVNILIDTGGSLYKDIALKVLIPYFNKHHITRINQVFISHNDYDHNGALTTLKNNIDIDNIIYGSTFYEVKVGDLIFFNLNQFQIGDEDNINSSVIYLKFIDMIFLFMGDAPKEIEDKIIERFPSLRADIIKLGHHGSNTSSSYTFLKHIAPKEAIISVGVNNIYHHPHSEVIKNLKALNIKIRRTDIEGSIIYH